MKYKGNVFRVFTLDLVATTNVADMHRTQTFRTSYCLYKHRLVNTDDLVDICRMSLRICLANANCRRKVNHQNDYNDAESTDGNNNKHLESFEAGDVSVQNILCFLQTDNLQTHGHIMSMITLIPIAVCTNAAATVHR